PFYIGERASSPLPQGRGRDHRRRAHCTMAQRGTHNTMPGVPITFACGLYDRMLALYTKEVKPDGIDLNFLPIDHPREIFDRMMKLEFEASEMSSSDYARYAVRGDCPMVAIPVFPSRVFRHGYIVVDKRQVKTPKDLAGKRIGVPLYAM